MPAGTHSSLALSPSMILRHAPHRISNFRIPGTRFFTAVSAKRSKQNEQQTTLTARDTSSKKWGQLNVKQKIVRTTSTGASLVTILAGLLVTGAVFTLFYTEVLAPDSTANWFNRAVDRIKNDPRCSALLGTTSSIKAYGEPTSNRWARNRPIASNHHTDKNGTQHLRLRFNVEGNVDRGVVHAYLVKRPDSGDFEYQYLYLDVPGQNRLYLENRNDKDGSLPKKKGMFGVSWGWQR